MWSGHWKLILLAGCVLSLSARELNMQSADPKKNVPAIPEMVGATSSPSMIGPGPSQISLQIHAPTGPAALSAGAARRQVSLRLENLTCDRRAPTFDVYLNVPPGGKPENYPELHAGSLGMFGLVESSTGSGNHPATGMTFKFDISELFARLSARQDWDPNVLRLSFVPLLWDAPVPQVRVGRVSLYFQ
jgi:tyrosinase